VAVRPGGGVVDVYVISDAGLDRQPVKELKRLLELQDVIVWVDIPLCGTADAELLLEVFGFHELAVRDCVERNHVSKIHTY
jgi:magnesium transporter